MYMTFGIFWLFSAVLYTFLQKKRTKTLFAPFFIL